MPYGQRFGHGLDTRAGGHEENAREGWHGGFRGAAYRRKDLVNLFHFSSAPPGRPAKPVKPAKAVHTPTEP